ncbi:MAG: hypothetical protein V3S55_06160 [Nitrospiraceae bacterium]
MGKRRGPKQFSHCGECGMSIGELDFHPYPACVMFRQVKQGDKVESYLQQIIQWGRRLERVGLPDNATVVQMTRAESKAPHD